MPPDLNSLPPSRSTSSSPFQSRTLVTAEGVHAPSSSPRSSTVSLAASATINAADMSRRSSTSMQRGSQQPGRVSERRRSTAAVNPNLNDPTLPAPGDLPSGDHRLSLGNAFRTASPTSIGGSPTIATGDPHHQRTPSLGEIHQELEQEQEAQVNRLLQMIRHQQAQLLQMQQLHQQQSSVSGTAIADDSTPTSERSISFPTVPPLPATGHRTSVQLPSNLSTRRGSNQATPSGPQLTGAQQGVPMEHTSSNSSAEWWILSGGEPGRRSSRDESAFYQAETAMLTRENQMLRQRIRELERQISELSTSAAHHPPAVSHSTTTSSAISTQESTSSPGVGDSSQSPTEEVDKP